MFPVLVTLSFIGKVIFEIAGIQRVLLVCQNIANDTFRRLVRAHFERDSVDRSILIFSGFLLPQFALIDLLCWVKEDEAMGEENYVGSKKSSLFQKYIDMGICLCNKPTVAYCYKRLYPFFQIMSKFNDSADEFI